MKDAYEIAGPTYAHLRPAKKHTPGPWNVQDWTIFHKDQAVAVAAIDNGLANAHLIAAAPDLLEALYRARTCLQLFSSRPPSFDGAIRLADDAIAKATQG